MSNNAQHKMTALLNAAGIPNKRVKVFGCQVMVTCWSRDAADRYAALLYEFCSRVRGPVESVEYNQVNYNTVLRPSKHSVWLVGGTIVGERVRLPRRVRACRERQLAMDAPPATGERP